MVGTNARDSRLEAKRGETVHKLVTEGARAREGGRGRGRKKLNRGSGAAGEGMVGPKNRRGPGPGLGGQRGAGNEDEDADEDADQENEEKEVTEQEKQEEEGASGDTRRDAAEAPVIRRGGRGCRPSRGVSPASAVRARSGGRVNPLSRRREVPMNFATLNKK